MSVLSMYLCTVCMQCPQRPAEGIRYTRTGVTDSCELLCGCWEWNPGPQKEQAALLSTKPSPHPPILLFWREQWHKQQFIPPWAATLKIFTPWLFSEERFALLCSESPTLRKKQSLPANNSHWCVSYTIPAVGLCPSPASQFRGKIEHCEENSRESYKD